MGRERVRNALLIALTLVGCDRAPAQESSAATAPVVAPGSIAPTKVVVPTEAAPIAPAPKPPTQRASKPAAPVAAAAPTAPTPPATTGESATPFAPTPLVTDKLFRIELAPLAPCKATAACEAKLVVHALGGYKVNAEYPTKFVATPVPGVSVEKTGQFAVGSKTTGTLTVTFRAAAAGSATITGALKLSVCTEEICEIAAPVVAFDVPVTAP